MNSKLMRLKALNDTCCNVSSFVLSHFLDQNFSSQPKTSCLKSMHPPLSVGESSSSSSSKSGSISTSTIVFSSSSSPQFSMVAVSEEGSNVPELGNVMAKSLELKANPVCCSIMGVSMCIINVLLCVLISKNDEVSRYWSDNSVIFLIILRKLKCGVNNRCCMFDVK